tara:strand:+ start:240 stop:476 length:237 start_codon:yes stop_codon:yes gene_type:complete
MTHVEIVHSHIDPILNKYNATVEEIASNWRYIKPERKRELAKCINECLGKGSTTVWAYFSTFHTNAIEFTGKIRRWSY